MPRSAAQAKAKPGAHKRHGRHHKKTHHYAKVYAPYLPLVLAIVASLLISIIQPTAGRTLAYATDMSHGGLLGVTNAQRSGSGRGGLANNQLLNNAAQAKANDMVARNYWPHTTPDGQAPWTFIANAGYAYARAGENLAYGFTNSSQTVAGWMNSPSHQANMLDAGFTEVGFGFANGANFNGQGEQTVVVALYATPQAAPPPPPPAAPVAAAPTAAPPASPPSTPAPQPDPVPTGPAPAETPAPVVPSEEEAAIEPDLSALAAALQTDGQNPVIGDLDQTRSQEISRIQTLTNGRAPWALGATSLILDMVILFWLVHHSLKLRHLIQRSERYVLHHPLLHSILAGLIIIGITLTRAAGTIL